MDFANKRVLIVEDDFQISKVYQLQLEKAGIFSILARNGEEAIELLDEAKPDLVTLDLMIPKKDGFWVLEEIRKNPKYKNIPIIIISNLGQESDKARAVGLGATEYWVKVDMSIKDIIEKIKVYLKI